MTEEILLQKRLEELAARAYERNCFTFTEFLGLYEQDVLHRMEHRLSYAHITLYGGSNECERVLARFGDPEAAGYEEPFPITCIQATPKMQKYADALTHRDVLGALMHLGIERSCIGDIFLSSNIAYFFCLAHIAPLITEELTCARHTALQCKMVYEIPKETDNTPIQMTLQVSSVRADAVVCAVFSLSRQIVQTFFVQKKVFINGKNTENAAVPLREQDLISVRGLGRFRFLGIAGTTRKGKLRLLIERYS